MCARKVLQFSISRRKKTIALSNSTSRFNQASWFFFRGRDISIFCRIFHKSSHLEVKWRGYLRTFLSCSDSIPVKKTAEHNQPWIAPRLALTNFFLVSPTFSRVFRFSLLIFSPQCPFPLLPRLSIVTQIKKHATWIGIKNKNTSYPFPQFLKITTCKFYFLWFKLRATLCYSENATISSSLAESAWPQQKSELSRKQQSWMTASHHPEPKKNYRVIKD